MGKYGEAGLEYVHEDQVKRRDIDEPECRRYSNVRNYLGGARLDLWDAITGADMRSHAGAWERGKRFDTTYRRFSSDRPAR